MSFMTQNIFFDGFHENPAYALQTIREAAKAGADLICLCDTNGGTLPHEVAIAVKRARKTVRVPLGIHCHNDSNLGVANSITAIQHGALQVQGTINGYGERCGNANLTSVIPVLQAKLGYKVLSEKKLKQLTTKKKRRMLHLLIDTTRCKIVMKSI